MRIVEFLVLRPNPVSLPEPIGLLVTPQFSMMAVVALFDPLRVANKLSGRPLFDCRLLSEEGGTITAANAMSLRTEAISSRPKFSTVIVCSSYEPRRYATKKTLAWLRALARNGACLGAIDTGCHLLAIAGLLNGYKVAMHWEVIAPFMEEFPDIEVTDTLFEIDRDRITCAGGAAGYDLMLNLIASRHGHGLAVAVAEQFVHGAIRQGGEPQRMALAARAGTLNRQVLSAISAIEGSLEDPMSLSALAACVGTTARNLDRLFRSEIGEPPVRYAAGLRLRRARELLQQTDIKIMDAALATGFRSQAHFSRAYRKMFGQSPKEDRHRLSYFVRGVSS